MAVLIEAVSALMFILLTFVGAMVLFILSAAIILISLRYVLVPLAKWLFDDGN